MADLQGQVGELTFQVQVTRADGRVEDYTLVGRITDEQLKEIQNGSNPLDGSTQRGD